MSSFSPKNSGSVAGTAGTFDPWILWVTFRRCWFWAVPAGAVLAGLMALYVVKSFVPTYKATHLLEANQDYVVFQGVMPAPKNLARTEHSLFFNSIVLDPVLADPEYRLAPGLSDPETAEMNLKRNLKIYSPGTENRLVVSYEDSDRKAAAMICNAVVESYLRQRDAFDNTRVANLERWLEPEIRRWEQEVSERQLVVQKLSEQTLGYAPGRLAAQLDNSPSLSLANRLRSEIADLSLQISIGEAKIAMRANGEMEPGEAESDVDEITPLALAIKLQPTELEIENLVRNDETVVEAKSHLKRYEKFMIELEDQGRHKIRANEYQRYKSKASQWENILHRAEKSARVTAKLRLEELAQKEVEKYLANTRDEAFGQASLNKRRRSQDLMRRQQEHDDLKTRLSVLKQQYDQERIRLEQFGGATAELQFAQEELGVSRDVLLKLRNRVAAIRTERRQNGAVRSLAPATAPRTPVEAIPFKKLIVYSSALFVVPFLFGVAWEVRVQRLTDSTMCDRSGMAVVGEVVRLPSVSWSDRSRRIFEESIDTLRTSLFLSLATKDIRSIAVVSGMTSEGKTSVASQLAMSIAKATGETVLLVDGDLRCPEQHDIFDLPIGPGFSDVLVGDVALGEAVNRSQGELIHVLTAGEVAGSRHRVINPDSIQTFVDNALQHYSYVVLDTPPILSAAESLAIASVVDSSLLCVMRDVSRVENVARTIGRLEAVGARIAGTVFNGVSPRNYADRYGDYYNADRRKAS